MLLYAKFGGSLNVTDVGVTFRLYMRGSRKFCQRGSTFDTVFLADEGKEDPNTTINGTSSARQRNAIEMAFRWRADDGLQWRFAGGPMMAQH